MTDPARAARHWLVMVGATLWVVSVGDQGDVQQPTTHIARCLTACVVPLLANGQVKPVIERIYPLEEITEAHRAMGENRNFGKLVVRVD